MRDEIFEARSRDHRFEKPWKGSLLQWLAGISHRVGSPKCCNYGPGLHKQVIIAMNRRNNSSKNVCNDSNRHDNCNNIYSIKSKSLNRKYNMQMPAIIVWQQRKEFFFSKFMNLQRTLALPTSESSGTWVLGNLLGVNGD